MTIQLNKLLFALTFLIVVFGFYNIYVTFMELPSAFVIDQPESEFVKIMPDTIEINKNELKFCCRTSKGYGCWILERHSCGHCKPYCKND